MNIAYLALLRLYPAWYRGRFGTEMADVFEEARRDEWREGWLRYTRFLLQELIGLVQGALAVWVNAGRSQPHIARRVSLGMSVWAGAIVTFAVHGSVYRGVNSSFRISGLDIYSDADKFTLLVMMSLCCLLVAILVVALFYMTERSIHARTRTARRHQGLYGNPRGAGRQLRGARR